MLTKSRYLAGIQCPKRLWLEVHKPGLKDTPDFSLRKFDVGHTVTEVARKLEKGGILISEGGNNTAIRKTKALVAGGVRKSLFEGAFAHRDVLVRTDILRPVRGRFHLVEVKSSTSVHDKYLPDCAVQAWVVNGAGLGIGKVKLAHLDRDFVYRGDGNYEGLFHEEDVTARIDEQLRTVPRRAREFIKVIAGEKPDTAMGSHCHAPYECPFQTHCDPRPPRYPVECLPGGAKTAAALRAEGIRDIRRIPAGRLTNATHEWVRKVTRAGTPDVRAEHLDSLRALGWPRYFLDFETVAFPVPRWAGTRPWEAIPFQWSCHVQGRDGGVRHREFLDVSGRDPMRAFAVSLIKALGTKGPVFVYSSYEKQRIEALGSRFRDLAKALDAIVSRLVDLLPVTRKAYYHPEMRGVWGIKSVLPTVDPRLSYDNLGEVQEGGGINEAYLELVDAGTAAARKKELTSALTDYCKRDTEGLVALMNLFQRHLG